MAAESDTWTRDEIPRCSLTQTNYGEKDLRIAELIDWWAMQYDKRTESVKGDAFWMLAIPVRFNPKCCRQPRIGT